MTKINETSNRDPLEINEDHLVIKVKKFKRWDATEDDEQTYQKGKNSKKRTHHQKSRKQKMWEDLPGNGL